MPVHPSENEEEYFARQEARKRIEAQAKLAAEMADEEKQRLKETHFMHCPKCGVELHEETLDEVAVDVCPGCQGVWLDDGELAKLIEGRHGVLAKIRGLFS